MSYDTTKGDAPVSVTRDDLIINQRDNLLDCADKTPLELETTHETTITDTTVTTVLTRDGESWEIFQGRSIGAVQSITTFAGKRLTFPSLDAHGRCPGTFTLESVGSGDGGGTPVFKNAGSLSFDHTWARQYLDCRSGGR